MSSQYRNSELGYEAPARYESSESMQRPVQLAYADFQNNVHQGDVYLGNLPSVQFEERSSHHHYHHANHHYHHRRHGEVAVSHSYHAPHHEYHHVQHTAYHHHRPYHHHNYSHAEHSGVRLSYSHHQRSEQYEAHQPRVEHVNFNANLNSRDHADFAHGPVANSVRAMENKLAQIALHVAHRLGTVGNCAYGPRLTFDRVGYHLAPAVATAQGHQIMNARTGNEQLFEKISAADARPGDYGVRDWNNSVQRRNGDNKGDSFIVTGRARNGALTAANDHTFVVPADGGRYKNLTFWRPTEAFVRLYGDA